MMMGRGIPDIRQRRIGLDGGTREVVESEAAVIALYPTACRVGKGAWLEFASLRRTYRAFAHAVHHSGSHDRVGKDAIILVFLPATCQTPLPTLRGEAACSLVPVDALAALVALLRFDRQGREGPCLKALDRDWLAGLLAEAVRAVLDARQRLVDLCDQLALAVARAQLDCPVGLR